MTIKDDIEFVLSIALDTRLVLALLIGLPALLTLSSLGFISVTSIKLITITIGNVLFILFLSAIIYVIVRGIVQFLRLPIVEKVLQ